MLNGGVPAATSRSCAPREASFTWTFRLTFTVLMLWVFTAAALTVGTWRVMHPLACVLIALLGCLAILLFFPPRAVMPYSLLFRTTGQLVSWRVS